MVGVVIGRDHIGGQIFHQGGGLRRIALLACRKREPNRAPQAAHGQVYLGAGRRIIGWHYIAPGKSMQNRYVETFRHSMNGAMSS